jgi:ABC-type uncharacterized transport system permease subunit
MWRTRYGYELRAVGLAPKAAEYGGVNIGRNVVLAMAISGALAGLAATHYVLGGALEEYRLKQSIPADAAGFGGITVALLGANTPAGVVVAATLFGVLGTGGLNLDQALDRVSRDIVTVLQALIVLFVATGASSRPGCGGRRRPSRPRVTRRPGRAGSPPSPARRSASPTPSRSRGHEEVGVDLALAVLLASAIRQTTPLLLAAMGGLYAERGGVVNIALEGIMIFGALAAAVVAERLEAGLGVPGWAPWAGVLAAALVGALIALLHGVVSIRYKADQVISGTAINLLAGGVPAVVLQSLYANTTDSDPVRNALPGSARAPSPSRPSPTSPSSWCR